MSQISEEEFIPVMKAIRNLRAWAVREQIDPWALRQGLLVALEIDTDAALKRGIPRKALSDFDAEVRQDIRLWMAGGGI